MRWKDKKSTYPEKDEWHDYFAWVPTWCNENGAWAWLETVERKFTYYREWETSYRYKEA